MKLTVSVSDAKVSGDPQDVVSTFSLGSCIGVSVYDPIVKVGGMLHFQLPEASANPRRAQENPAMFADSGLAMLLEGVRRLGAGEKRLKIILAGGAKILDESNTFNIGRRNHAAIRKCLWQRGLMVALEDCGGVAPRHMFLTIATGETQIKAVGFAAAV